MYLCIHVDLVLKNLNTILKKKTNLTMYVVYYQVKINNKFSLHLKYILIIISKKKYFWPYKQ